MSWVYIFIASLFEICWAVGLKYSNGFTKLYPSIFTGICMILSYLFLAMGSKNLPIGTAYAVWTGIGAAGTAIYGMIYFNESKELIRIGFIFLVVIGIIGLKVFSK
ncbi:MAG TPA: multidrug efflux SMR transporter [Melioribacteraceae bacterium]|nr:multidrug efflux SMR transporter [Melioribacteraceae bacterium]